MSEEKDIEARAAFAAVGQEGAAAQKRDTMTTANWKKTDGQRALDTIDAVSAAASEARGPMVHHEFGETAREQAERLHRTTTPRS